MLRRAGILAIEEFAPQVRRGGIGPHLGKPPQNKLARPIDNIIISKSKELAAGLHRCYVDNGYAPQTPMLK